MFIYIYIRVTFGKRVRSFRRDKDGKDIRSRTQKREGKKAKEALKKTESNEVRCEGEKRKQDRSERNNE